MRSRHSILRDEELQMLLAAGLRDCVARASTSESDPVVGALVEILRGELGGHLAGLIFYGSRLNRTAGTRSDWDFFVVLDGYGSLRGGVLRQALHRVLPPSIFRRKLELPNGAEAGCKLSFISLLDLERFTSARAPDSYLFGRLSKRVALVFTRDDDARDAILDYLARSVALCAAWTLVGEKEPLPVESLAPAAVGFSYRCEERVEAASRPQVLFDTDAAYFREIYAAAVAALETAGLARVDPAGRIGWIRSPRDLRKQRRAIARFVRRCRRRARWRWLKNVWTFEGWDDYMLAKIERHQGDTIVLSARERRYPLLSALRHYLRLRRGGRISGIDPEERRGET